MLVSQATELPALSAMNDKSGCTTVLHTQQNCQWQLFSSGFHVKFTTMQNANVTDLKTQWLTNQCHLTTTLPKCICKSCPSNISSTSTAATASAWLTEEETNYPTHHDWMGQDDQSDVRAKSAVNHQLFSSVISPLFKLYRINKWRSPSSVRSVEQLQATMAGQPDFDFNSWGLKK